LISRDHHLEGFKPRYYVIADLYPRSGPGQFSTSLWTPRMARRILWPMTLSARNRLQGKIVELQLGGVMAHVVIRVGENLIESVITKRSADEMKLKVGDTVSAIIKSTEVMLEKD
jgi:molybdopterin-binding protein